MKPDAVKRGIVGEILHRFERAGLKMVAVKLIQPNEALAEKHYPNTEKWKSTVGQRTIDECEANGIDLMENVGATDPHKSRGNSKKMERRFSKVRTGISYCF